MSDLFGNHIVGFPMRRLKLFTLIRWIHYLNREMRFTLGRDSLYSTADRGHLTDHDVDCTGEGQNLNQVRVGTQQVGSLFIGTLKVH